MDDDIKAYKNIFTEGELRHRVELLQSLQQFRWKEPAVYSYDMEYYNIDDDCLK